MSRLLDDFLKVAVGQVVWIDLMGAAALYQGKVECYDSEYVIISSDLGFDCLIRSQIRGVSLPRQVEIVTP
jgi:hypothetical protein